MKITPEIFLKSKIKEYYKSNRVEIKDIEKREFGYGTYGKKIANRHVEFRNNDELNWFLQNEAPFYLSYSVAYYELPGAKPMQAKRLLGGDMIFEFDSDDIPTDCKKVHDTWQCTKCGENGKGYVEKCPNCNANTKTEEFVCDYCIDATKKQTKKIYNALIDDFDFSSKEIKIMYSGHKGFHIKIISPEVYDLKQNQRTELMNYFSEDGLNFRALGFVEDEKGSIKYIGKNFGKGQKYLNYAITAIQNYDLPELTLLFDSYTRTIKKVANCKAEVVAELQRGIFPKLKEDSVSLWYNFLDNLKQQQKLMIDKQTTIDIHKIVRAENTIHAGAMLLSKVIEIDSIDAFNPFIDASPYSSGTLRIHLKKVPKLLLNGSIYGPYSEGEEVELPYNIGAYFVAKGVTNDIII